MTTSKEGAELAQYLTFTIGDEEYGTSVLAVREILEYDTVTRVPGAPGFIRGVINLRGRVVPVVDLAMRFGLAPSPVTKRTCVVIVEVRWDGADTVMGLMADAVNQVVELGPDDIQAPPRFGTRVDIAYLKGLGRAGKRFILLLDIERVISEADVAQVAALGADHEPDGPAAPETIAAAAGTVASLAIAFFLCLLAPAPARAQDAIQDNSFLIEEAYNQERGVVQHINTFARSAGSGDWLYTLTQEWPLPDEKHQVSFTLPVQELHTAVRANTGVGDVALNYRYQAIGNGSQALAVSPRLSVLLPTGRSRASLGAGGVGLQVNLPVSWLVTSRIVTHWNAGATHTFAAHDADDDRADTRAYNLGQSLVWLFKPRVNLLVETAWTRIGSVTAPGRTASTDALFVSPGIRWAHDFKNGLQIVPGLAFPIGIGPSQGQHAMFFYLSFEHPFRHRGQGTRSAQSP